MNTYLFSENQKGRDGQIELFCMAYGIYVTKLLRESPNNNPEQVNKDLDQIGYKMGQRLIDEFLSRCEKAQPCKDFPQIMKAIAQDAIRMFLGTEGELRNLTKDSVSLIIKDNPLADFVQLPEGYKSSLWYSNVLCGLVRGALEMTNVKVSCTFVKDQLRGDPETEIQVNLIEIMRDVYIDEDD